MRVLSVVFASLFLAGVTAAQAPTSKPAPAPAAKPAQAPAAKPARAAASKPSGTLAQLMRGVLFPNANIIFDVQQVDPGAPKVTKGGGAETGPATSAFASIYTGWQVVENAAIALEEVADLIVKPGRLCENGKPVPLQRADFVKFAQGLRVAARTTLAAARTKSQEKVGDATNDLADACLMCHEVYRDTGPADSPLRCVAPKGK